MRTYLLLAFELLIGTQALAPFHLSEPLGNNWNQYPTEFPLTWSKPFNITKNFLTGFSSGSMATTNILRLSAQNYDGFGILAGILMRNFSTQTHWNLDEIKIPDLSGKQVFTYFGSAEAEGGESFFSVDRMYKFQELYKQAGANVTSQYIHDFHHVFPSNLPVNDLFHPENTCNADPETYNETLVPPYKSWYRNCGYNLAYYLLQALNPNMIMNEQANDHTKYGDFHAFNQTPFTNGNPDAMMDQVGYIYIPHACKAGNFCQTVMFLHGCLQGAGWWNETEFRRTGLMEHAATNNLIIVFPSNDDYVLLNTGEYVDVKMMYCWSSMQTDDKHYAQIATLENIFNSLVLGSESSKMVSMEHQEVSQLAYLQKAYNAKFEQKQIMLTSTDQVLQV